MPCSKCGRTAKHEWWSFRFDSKAKEFYCSFCSPSAEDQESFRSILLLPFSLLLVFLLFLPFAALLGNFQDVDYSISQSSRLAESKDANLRNLTESETLKFTGVIATDHENASVVVYYVDGAWWAREGNFTLVTGSEEIEVLVGPFTRVYKFNSSDSRSRRFYDGDEVRVIGSLLSDNQSGIVVRANHLYDEEPDVDELRQGTFLAYLFTAPLVLFNIVVCVRSHISRLWSRGPSGSCWPTTGLSDEGQWQRILSEGKKVNDPDIAVRLILMLVFCFYMVFILKDVVPEGIGIMEPNILRLVQIVVTLFVFLLMVPLIAMFWKSRIRMTVVHDQGILFFSTTKEPLFLDWAELTRATGRKALPGVLGIRTSRLIEFKITEKRREAMDAELEAYRQRQEESKPTDSNVEQM